MKEKIKKEISKLVKLLESDKIFEIIPLAVFEDNRPSSKWSLMNKIIMILNGTNDARGIKQWNDVGRRVKKGAKAFYICVPYFKTVTEEDEEGNIVERKILTGFGYAPVFKVEDTEGREIENIELKIPKFPLMDKAKELGLKIEPEVFNGKCYGSYNPKDKKIKISSPEAQIFFHELAHALYHHLNGHVDTGQVYFQEVVAELAAGVLCELHGYKAKTGNIKAYIKHYQGQKQLKIAINIIQEVEKILDFLMAKNGG